MQQLQSTIQPSIDEQVISNAEQALRQVGAYFGFGTQGLEIYMHEQVQIARDTKQIEQERIIDLVEEQAYLAEVTAE